MSSNAGNRFQGLFEAQHEHFLTDVTKSYEWRIDQLDRMERMLLDNKDVFCAALSDDFGKPPFEQLFEITVPSGVIDYYRRNLHELMAPQPVPIPAGLEATGNSGIIYKEPYGVTLVIGPFNAPILLLLDPAVAALAAGNTVVLKPANTTPATAALFQKLIPQYFAPENLTVVTGGREEIGALLELPFDFIFFTGSSAVGKVVMRAAAEHLTPVVLELGGQNPTIVDETANLDTAADRIAWGHNAISGQWCIAPGYVCVQDSVADAFIAKLKTSIVKMYGEDPSKSPDFARMISEHDAERVASYILPEKVVHGGRFDVKARYVEPTVLYPSDWGDPALQQEVFGPVLPVMTYRDLKATLDIVKRRPKPLAAYIFSKDQATIDTVLASLSFGGGCINQTNLHCWIDSLPFGGVGNSGMGKYYGKAGFDALSNTKAIRIGRSTSSRRMPARTSKRISASSRRREVEHAQRDAGSRRHRGGSGPLEGRSPERIASPRNGSRWMPAPINSGNRSPSCQRLTSRSKPGSVCNASRVASCRSSPTRRSSRAFRSASSPRR